MSLQIPEWQLVTRDDIDRLERTFVKPAITAEELLKILSQIDNTDLSKNLKTRRGDLMRWLDEHLAGLSASSLR